MVVASSTVFVVPFLVSSFLFVIVAARMRGGAFDTEDGASSFVVADNGTSSPPHVSHANCVNWLYSRINCFPEQQGSESTPWRVSQDECERRGCSFEPAYGIPGVPPCFMSPRKIGYVIAEKLVEQGDGRVLFQAKLRPISNFTIFDPPVQSVLITAEVMDEHHLRVKIEDSHNERFEVPFHDVLEKHGKKMPEKRKSDAAKHNEYEFEFTDNPFTFRIIRRATGTVLFDTSMGGFVFSDRFLQISTRLPSHNFYGLGEHEHPSLKHNLYYKTWGMFARDQGGLGENFPLYGVHPFYMVVEDDGNSHGVFLMNSNAMEYALIPAPGVIVRTIGGIFDFHIYTGPTPGQVVQQHTAFVGRPYMPPYWSLGFQLSRWDYNNLTTMKEVVERTRNYSIPLDVIYADIDHMEEFKDFTLDHANFGGMPEYFLEETNQNGLRLVIILDPAVTNNASSYDTWHILDGNDTFIKWTNESEIMGYVWPEGHVAFPDFFLDRTHHVWTDLIKRHAELVPFEGLWIDMNEPANFATNMEKPENYPDHLPPWSLKCPLVGLDNPPYRTRAVSVFDKPGVTTPLCDRTICMESLQNDGAYRHYDVHSLYGWSQSFPTYKAMREARPGRRPFVLARSTFAGSGTVASHWLGDNKATWEHMQRSIIGMLEMSMFGIAHTGADICGFIDPTTPELCKRWMELGAFYPYSRNHNDNLSPPQDPGYFGPEVADTSRAHLTTRYQLLPYMYTLFHLAHTTGTTVARPLFFEFPRDANALDIDRQFMLGKSVMIAPILEPGQEGVNAFLPQGTWWYHDSFQVGKDKLYEFCDEGHQVYVNQSGAAVFQRGGSVIVFQKTGSSLEPGFKIISTKLTRNEKLIVNVVFDCDKTASGELYWDDGDSYGPVQTGKYWLAGYQASYNESTLSFSSKIEHTSTDLSFDSELSYSHVQFINVPKPPVTPVLTCSQDVNCPHLIPMSYDDATKTAIFKFDGKFKFAQNWSISAGF